MEIKAFVRLTPEMIRYISGFNSYAFDKVRYTDIWMATSNALIINNAENNNILYNINFKEALKVLNNRANSFSGFEYYKIVDNIVLSYQNSNNNNNINKEIDIVNNSIKQFGKLICRTNYITANKSDEKILNKKRILSLLKEKVDESLIINHFDWTSLQLDKVLDFKGKSFTDDNIILEKRSRYGAYIISYNKSYTNNRRKRYNKKQERLNTEKNRRNIINKYYTNNDAIISNLRKIAFHEECWKKAFERYNNINNIIIVLQQIDSIDRTHLLKGNKTLLKLINSDHITNMYNLTDSISLKRKISKTIKALKQVI